MDNGYVLLHRKLFSNKIWLSERFTKSQAWIDLFANANHADGSIWVRGIEIKIKRGQLGWSEQTMAQRWGWSRNKVRRFLVWLKSESQVDIETIHQKMKLKSIITILNYDRYQERYNRRYNRKTSEGTTDDTVTKNDKEELKNDKQPAEVVSSQTDKEIAEVIAAFANVNPAYKKWFGNTTQRAAVSRMLETHGKELLLQVVGYLPKSNTYPYVPTVTSPYILEMKWADLQAGLIKLKNKSIINQPKVIF